MAAFFAFLFMRINCIHQVHSRFKFENVHGKSSNRWIFTTERQFLHLLSFYLGFQLTIQIQWGDWINKIVSIKLFIRMSYIFWGEGKNETKTIFFRSSWTIACVSNSISWNSVLISHNFLKITHRYSTTGRFICHQVRVQFFFLLTTQLFSHENSSSANAIKKNKQQIDIVLHEKKASTNS